jgi:hypothetical protein
MNPPIPPIPPAPGMPPFPAAPPKKSNWWMIGGCGCLGMIVLGIGLAATIFFFVVNVIKGTEPYQTALTAAANAPEVQAELGTPIEAGFMPQGHVNSNTSNGNTTETADLTIPLKGPKGSGRVHYSARKSGGDWEVSDWTVTIDGSGNRIDLKGPLK